MARKRRITLAPTWQYVGLGVLAVATAGVVGFVVLEPKAPPPVSEKVATYTPPPVKPRVVTNVAVVGDSYSAGTGAQPTMGWVDQLGRNQGWNVTNVARGGTGYVTEITAAATAKKACGLDACPSYAAMIPDVVAAKPQIVIVAGGRNDSKVAPEAEAAAIRDFYTQLRAALPDAKIVGFNALWDSTAAPPAVSQVSASVQAAVAEVGGAFIDAGQPLKDHPELVGADGVHPNDKGHAAIFRAKLAALQGSGLAVK